MYNTQEVTTDKHKCTRYLCGCVHGPIHICDFVCSQSVEYSVLSKLVQIKDSHPQLSQNIGGDCQSSYHTSITIPKIAGTQSINNRSVSFRLSIHLALLLPRTSTKLTSLSPSLSLKLSCL